MFEAIKKLLTGSGEQSSDKQKLEDPHIALCVLLLEAAYADGECSKNEKSNLVSILVKEYGVDSGEVEKLVDRSDSERRESTDLFRFTRHINNTLNDEEKLDLMESVWRIILLDNVLEAHEDQFAHKLANLLRLTHKQLIDTKLQARKKLA